MAIHRIANRHEFLTFISSSRGTTGESFIGFFHRLLNLPYTYIDGYGGSYEMNATFSKSFIETLTHLLIIMDGYLYDRTCITVDGISICAFLRISTNPLILLLNHCNCCYSTLRTYAGIQIIIRYNQ